jgi:FkbM family methyltransferase
MSSENDHQSQSQVKNIKLEFPVGDEKHSFLLELDLNEFSQKSMWNFFSEGKLYEPETSNLFCKILKPGDTFIDAGGHIGYFSLLASSIVGKDGLVFTFEPEDSNRAHILQNIINNQITNIQVSELALGDSEADLEFYINADNDGGHAFWDVSRHDYNRKSREQMETRVIHQTSLDHHFANSDLGNLTLIKMDIEGSEYNALIGGKETLIRYHYPTVILEMNRFALKEMGSTEEDVRAFMKDLGYETYFPTEEGMIRIEDGTYVDVNYVFNLVFAQAGRL